MIARLIIVGLAATRLTRAIQHEKIGEPVRDFIDTRLNPGLPADIELDLEALVRREWLDELFTCDRCFGFWITLGVAAAWRIRPARPIIEALAASAILSVAVDHYPGWNE